MKYLEFKGILSFLIIFLMVSLKEINCGPVGRPDSSEDHNLHFSLLKLLLSSIDTQQVTAYPTLPSNHYLPSYKSKFKPWYSHGSFDYPESSYYVNQQRNWENPRHGKFANPWIHFNSKEVIEPTNHNKNENSYPWKENRYDQNSFDYFSNEDKSSSEEDSKQDHNMNNDHRGYPNFNHKSRGFNFNHGSFGPNFGQNNGFNHHGFGFNHVHTPGCHFPHGNKRPHPRPPTPAPRPTASPTIVPTTTNLPTVAPTPNTPSTDSIDPRMTSMASVVSSDVPMIDIRFDSGPPDKDAIVFPNN